MLNFLNNKYEDLQYNPKEHYEELRKQRYFHRVKALVLMESAVADFYINVLHIHRNALDEHFGFVHDSMDQHMDNAYFWRNQLPLGVYDVQTSLDEDILSDLKVVFAVCDKGAKMDFTSAIDIALVVEKLLLKQYQELRRTAPIDLTAAVGDYIRSLVEPTAKKNIRWLNRLVPQIAAH
jgi:hypothetical protein